MDTHFNALWFFTAYAGACHLLLLKKQAADEGTGKCNAGKKYADGKAAREAELSTCIV